MVVVLLCGIPGSGKSTLARAISSIARHQEVWRSCSIFSFDDADNTVEWGAGSFQAIRATNLESLNNHLRSVSQPPHPAGGDPEGQNEGESAVTSNPAFNEASHLTVVDDIMYLKSMRRQVYVICRELSIPLLVVWLRCSLNLAQQRNADRAGKSHVAEVAIEKLWRAMEPPDAAFICDRNNLTVDVEGISPPGSIDVTSAAQRIIERAEEVMQSFYAAKMQLLKQQSKRKGQVVSTESFTGGGGEPNISIPVSKRLDDALRRTVSSVMRDVASSTLFSVPERKEISRILAAAKIKTLKSPTFSAPASTPPPGLVPVPATGLRVVSEPAATRYPSSEGDTESQTIPLCRKLFHDCALQEISLYFTSFGCCNYSTTTQSPRLADATSGTTFSLKLGQDEMTGAETSEKSGTDRSAQSVQTDPTRGEGGCAGSSGSSLQPPCANQLTALNYIVESLGAACAENS